VQLALRSDWTTEVLRAGSRKFVVAGVAVVGASLIAANPLAPNVAADIDHKVVTEIQHRAVQLTSGGSDVLDAYGDLFAQTGANLQTLISEAGVAYPHLLNAVGGSLQSTANIFNTAGQGTSIAVQNALFNGWYGSDDGYVFGLIGGSLTHNGVTESGSTLQEILSSLAQGNIFNAYGYYDEWSLEALQHITKPLLSPFLNEAKTGAAPTPTLFNSFLQGTASVYNSLFSYSNLQALFQGASSPGIGVAFGALGEAGTIGADLSSLNFGGAVTELAKAPAVIAGDFLNGYVYPGSTKAFTGMLNSGSLLQELLYTLPNQLTTALGGSTTSSLGTAATSLSGVLSNVPSLLPNLAAVVNPSLLVGNLGAALAPMLANIASQLSATLAPSLISGLLMHLPALILAML
jgi:hypothetical protein